MTIFGENLKRYRDLLGISQVDLAKSLGITQGMISMYETHNRQPPSIKALEDIAKELRCSVDDLIGEEEDAKITIVVRNLKGLSSKQLDLVMDIIKEFKKESR